MRWIRRYRRWSGLWTMSEAAVEVLLDSDILTPKKKDKLVRHVFYVDHALPQPIDLRPRSADGHPFGLYDVMSDSQVQCELCFEWVTIHNTVLHLLVNWKDKQMFACGACCQRYVEYSCLICLRSKTRTEDDAQEPKV